MGPGLSLFSPKAISDSWIWATTLLYLDYNHLFFKHLLSTYYEPGTSLSAEEKVINKKYRHCPH